MWDDEEVWKYTCVWKFIPPEQEGGERNCPLTRIMKHPRKYLRLP